MDCLPLNLELQGGFSFCENCLGTKIISGIDPPFAAGVAQFVIAEWHISDERFASLDKAGDCLALIRQSYQLEIVVGAGGSPDRERSDALGEPRLSLD